MSASVEYATVSVSAEGTPESKNFGDVYFSRADGVAETTYVFLEQNNLNSRWRSLSPHDRFVIAETGFGSGLNFLLSWQLFKQTAPQGAQLHFISFEKYPIRPADLKQIHQQWPDLTDFCETLQQNYPPNLKGIHRISVASNVTLDLCFGDINDCLPDWAAANPGVVHAWFLDGFAPGKNPEMWSEPLFNCISQSMAATATLSTFTATGDVRRGLQRAGIDMKKVKGFGHKRNMLRGSKHSLANPDSSRVKAHEHLIIIGGGIAGASIATQLKEHQGPITVIIKGPQAADGASGNPQGAVYPLLQAEWNNVSEFYSHGFLRAKQFYTEFAPDVCFWRGVQLLGHSPKTIQRFRDLAKASYPSELFRLYTKAQAEHAANYQHGYCAAQLPGAGWVEPAKLVQSLMSQTAEYRSCNGLPLTITTEAEVTSLEQSGNGWRLTVNTHKSDSTIHADHVILASGAALTSLLPEQLIPIRPAQGQVIQVNSQQLSCVDQVLCHKGYVAPQHNGLTTLGATFNKGALATSISEKDSREILNLTNRFLGTRIAITDVVDARASVRATTPDHLPVVGRVPVTVQAPDAEQSLRVTKGLWVLCGLGARGFTSAPWCADLLVSQLYGKPIPCGERIRQALSPSRFAQRALRRNQPLSELK